MKNGRIKTVFFDAADTLFYIREGLGHTYAGVARKYGSDAGPERIKKAFSRAFGSAPPLAFGNVSKEERKGLEKQWWRTVVEDVYNEVGMFDEFDAHFDELFEVFRSDAWALFPETIEVLSTLRSRGYNLGIISNFDSRVYDVMERLEIYQFFDTFVISSEAGHAKPAHGIYSLALERTGSDPRESMHIGDDLENDFHGPRALGIKTLLLDREGQFKSDGGVDRIENLRELEKHL
ncbi:MAG: HAD-IA family hydrolase [Deltaproteobacteria bacterium]